MTKILIILLISIPLILNAQYENENSIIINNIEYYMAIDKYTYDFGDSVHMKYKITNLGSFPITLTFYSSQEFDFLVTQDSEEIWRWSCGQIFLTFVWIRTINPGDSSQALYSWDMTDNLGDLISSGNYEATGFFACSYNTPVSVNFEYTPVDVDNEIIVNSESILSNYPNPFNPETTINYSLKENSKVSLNIYNIKGQKVNTLVNEMISAGEHSVIWDGRDSNGNRVGSGIYFYKLKVGDFQKIKKMILLK
jgi:hypothetical protein